MNDIILIVPYWLVALVIFIIGVMVGKFLFEPSRSSVYVRPVIPEPPEYIKKKFVKSD